MQREMIPPGQCGWRWLWDFEFSGWYSSISQSIHFWRQGWQKSVRLCRWQGVSVLVVEFELGICMVFSISSTFALGSIVLRQILQVFELEDDADPALPGA